MNACCAQKRVAGLVGAPASLPACVVPLASAPGLLPRELLMDDVDTLADWLRSKARIHKTILPSTLRKLEEEEIFDVEDLALAQRAGVLDDASKFTRTTAIKLTIALGQLNLLDGDRTPDRHTRVTSRECDDDASDVSDVSGVDDDEGSVGEDLE